MKLGQYGNIVTATGKDQATNVTVTATDTSYHFGVASGPQLAAAQPNDPVLFSGPSQPGHVAFSHRR